LGIEDLPLKAEYTINPEREMPHGLVLGLGTLAVLAFATYFVSASVPPGASWMAATTYPMLEGYYYVFGASEVTRWSCLILVAGLMSSLHSFVFASGELIAQMAEYGLLPTSLGSESATFSTPAAAITAGSVAAAAMALSLYFTLGQNVEKVTDVTIAMCLLFTLISYVVQLGCFLWLRREKPNVRPSFRSPFGVAGAVIGLAVCLVTLATVLYLPVRMGRFYCYGLVLAAAMMAIAVVAHDVVARRSREDTNPSAEAGFASPGALSLQAAGHRRPGSDHAAAPDRL